MTASVNPIGAPPTVPKLFISYRRADSANIAGRIYDRLTAYFGREAIFKDVDNIPIGANFEQVIAGVIGQCAATLVLIGPQWVTMANERGRRLDDPQDVVRLEVEAALRRGIPVIPLLVEGADMPDVATLPPSLQPLFVHGTMQARNDPWFDADMSELATVMSRWLPLRSAGAAAAAPGMAPSQPGATPATTRKRNRLTSPVGLLAIATLVVAVVLLSLTGAGLAGAGPFGALGSHATPLPTAPRAPTATPTPAEHVVLDASLTRAQTGWELDDGCAFQNDGYHSIAPASYINYCIGPSSYGNFHLSTQVHVRPGTTGWVRYRLFFRISGSNDFDYFGLDFQLVPSMPPTPTLAPGAATPTPDYSIQASWLVFSHVNGVGTDLGGDLTPGAHVTGDGDNILEVYANGPSFTIWVNQVQIGSFEDARNTVGKIGLGVESGEAIYTSIKVATLAA